MAHGRNHARDGHSSATPVARRLMRPTRTARPGSDPRVARFRETSRRRPYSVLLPVGFAMPPALPPARCALTAPFHPCRAIVASREGGTGRGGLLSVALSLGLHPPVIIRHRM